jgi:hypothetical protein
MSGKIKFLYDEHLDNPSTTIRVYNTKDNNDLIMKAFYQDDFHMSITNMWSTGEGGMMKGLVDAAAKMVTSRDGRMMADMGKKLLDSSRSTMKEGTAGRRMADNLANGFDTLRRYQHASFFSADDFYKTFKGTNVTFPLNFQVTLVSDEKNPKLDIYDKLRKLLNVSIGDYDTTAGGYVGIQHAPNGFESGGFDLADSSVLMEGTLRVTYGNPREGGYVLNNMLISNIHCTFSKTKVQVGDNTWRPLYIDVQVMLEPGKKFTKDDIANTIGISKDSFSTSPNFTWENGKTDKGTEEEAEARRAELAKKKEILERQKREESFQNAFRGFPQVTMNFDPKTGTMRIVAGEFESPEDEEAFNLAVSEMNISEDYPGVLPPLDILKTPPTLPANNPSSN